MTTYPRLHLPEDCLPAAPRLFARQVAGDSMTGDNIMDGDYVLCDPDREPEDGDIAIVFVHDWRSPVTGHLCTGRVIKHVRFRPDGMTLESSNLAYPPMTLTAANKPRVEAVAVGVVRHIGGELPAASR